MPLKRSDPYGMEAEAGSLWSVASTPPKTCLGGGAVWVVGAGTGDGGTLTRITP